jgi:hypothetical protein
VTVAGGYAKATPAHIARTATVRTKIRIPLLP